MAEPTAKELSPPSVRGLADLDAELRRRRARATRRWRIYRGTDESDPDASAAAHRAWSNAIDQALAVAEEISRRDASNLEELSIQFEGAWWWIVEDDSILDGGARRWLLRFRRSLRKLATQN